MSFGSFLGGFSGGFMKMQDIKAKKAKSEADKPAAKAQPVGTDADAMENQPQGYADGGLVCSNPREGTHASLAYGWQRTSMKKR